MAVTATLKKRTSVDNPSGREYVHVYLVETTASESEAGVWASGALPELYSTYQNAVCRNRTLEPMKDPTDPYWTAVITYVTRTVTLESVDPEKPWKQPAEIAWGPLLTEVALVKAYQAGDTQGTPSLAVLNPCRDPFDPPPTALDKGIVIMIDRNFRDYDPTFAKTYVDTVNNVAIKIAGIDVGAQQGYMRDLSPSLAYTGTGTAYYTVHFEVHVKTKGHRRELLNNGFYSYTGGDTAKKKQITRADIDEDVKADSAQDTPVTEPQLLAANGTLLGAGVDPTYSTFQDKWELSWELLGLPVRKDGKQ